MTVTWMTREEKSGGVEYGVSSSNLDNIVQQTNDASSYTYNSQYEGVYTSGAMCGKGMMEKKKGERALSDERFSLFLPLSSQTHRKPHVNLVSIYIFHYCLSLLLIYFIHL